MGFYSSWHIVCVVKPEHVALVRHFLTHHEWPDPVPEFIASWRRFLERAGRVQAFPDGSRKHLYCPPHGGSTFRWGYKNGMSEDGTWTMAGEMKNYHNEIQAFLRKVLIHVSDSIVTCHLTNENAIDRFQGELEVDSDAEDDDSWYLSYSDADLRNKKKTLLV